MISVFSGKVKRISPVFRDFFGCPKKALLHFDPDCGTTEPINEGSSPMEPYVRTAQYHETDQMGVIHHANYVKWMEEARVAFMAGLGFGYETIEAQGITVPVIGIELTYKKPVRFAETFAVDVCVRRYNGKILELGYTIRNLTQGTLCTLAGSKHCFLKDGRMVALSAALPELDGVLRTLLNGKENPDADV